METGIAILLLWVASGIAGTFAGHRRQACEGGFLLGILLGPVGVIAALGLEGRPQCPRCAGLLDGRGKICQHCHVPLDWMTWGGPRLMEEKRPAPMPPTPPKAKPPTPAEVGPKAKPVGGWG